MLKFLAVLVLLQPLVWAQPDLTTTIRPEEGGPCENCIIVNGVGYAPTDNCWSFWQCFLQADGTWLQVRRNLAVGAFWNAAKLTGFHAVDVNCPTDPCINQPNGTLVSGYENCRAQLMCMGGATVSASCCPTGQAFSNGQCVDNSDCNDFCAIATTTPPTCYLSPVEGNPQQYFVERVLGDGVPMVMNCSIGTVYDRDTCGCIHDESSTDQYICQHEPELILRFGPNDEVKDVSKNRYTAVTENFKTVEISPGVYAGDFNGNSRLYFTNANSGLTHGVTIKIIYITGSNVPNAALVTDADCIGTTRTISVIDDNGGSRGFARTQAGDTITDRSATNLPQKSVIYQYDLKNVLVSTNGNVVSSPAAGAPVLTRSCDRLQFGNGRDMNGFVGQILEAELYKCVANGPQDFVRHST